MHRVRGFTLVELLIFMSALIIPIFFLIYYSPGISAGVQGYRCKKNLRKISIALHIYAAQDPDQSFPQASSAELAFRKIFVKGGIEDPSVFNDPRRYDVEASGTPGPFFLSPSADLKDVGFLYFNERLSMSSDSHRIIVVTRPIKSPTATIYALHLDGMITQESVFPAGEYV